MCETRNYMRAEMTSYNINCQHECTKGGGSYFGLSLRSAALYFFTALFDSCFELRSLNDDQFSQFRNVLRAVTALCVERRQSNPVAICVLFRTIGLGCMYGM
jgi:hypothetical protein